MTVASNPTDPVRPKRSLQPVAWMAVGALLAILLMAALPAAPLASEHKRFTAADSPLPFSQAVQAGDTLYVAGTLGLDPATGAPPEDPGAEVRLAMDEIKRRLEGAGMSMADVVSVQVYCPDLSLYEPFNAAYRTYFEEGAFPARAFLGSGPLLRGARFEIVATAVRQ